MTKASEPSKQTVASVEAKARKGVDKALAAVRAEVVKVKDLRKGAKLRRLDGVTGVVLRDPAKGGEFVIIDWVDAEREGWNDKALRKGKVTIA